MGARQGARFLVGFPLLRAFPVFFVLVLLRAQAGRSGPSLNLEGSALLELRARVEADPHGALENWDSLDGSPCRWSGVRCFDGKVETLNLTGLDLAGTLAPEIGSLNNLRYLLLPKNNFHGEIPKAFGELASLEVLDLSSNNLDGSIPEELWAMPLLRQLLLDNKVPRGASSYGIQDVTAEQLDQVGCLNRKLGCWLKFKSWISFSGLREKYPTNLPSFSEPHIIQNLQYFATAMRRRLLFEAGNLPALSGNDAKSQPVNSQEAPIPSDVLSLGSGSFPAFLSSQSQLLMPLLPQTAGNADAIPSTVQQLSAAAAKSSSSGTFRKWEYLFIVPAVVVLLSLVAWLILVWRKRGRTAIGPWRTGLSGQLRKAFVTGVPKLNRPELEAACEDFSNIINAFPDCTVFKGTLSNGTEICVISTVVSSIKDWSKSSEECFRKKIDTLSRVNHKNFINLLGYCQEDDDPFMRMMVFEYAPNGTLSEHLHLKEFEHLDWASRMRIVMGVAYCLQHMHHDLNPPVAMNAVRSNTVFMTDDYAGKIADIGVWKETAANADAAEAPSDLESNVYCFGALMIEIISGKLPEQDDQESLCNWAAEYLNSKCYSKLVDGSLKEHNGNELHAVCELIQECIVPDPKRRPTMRDITGKLRAVLGISPEAATPRLSPLWWAELELLSVEAS